MGLRESNERRTSGAKPIMASIIMKPPEGDQARKLYALKSEYINYFALEEEWEDLGHKNSGERSYVISGISESNKSSDGYFDCTGVAAVGTGKGTGKPVSFLTHQRPGSFLKEHKQQFADDLSSTLKDLKDQCEPGSIDVVIFGGNYSVLPDAEKPDEPTLAEKYKDSVKELGSIIQKIIGIDPYVISGPNLMDNPARAVLDTANRRMYIVKPDQDDTGRLAQNESFPASKVGVQERRWRGRNTRVFGSIDESLKRARIRNRNKKNKNETK